MRSFKFAVAAIAAAGLWAAAPPAAAQSGRHLTTESRVLTSDYPQSDSRDDWRWRSRDDHARARGDRRRYGDFAESYFFGGYDSTRAHDISDSGFFSDGDAVRTADGRVRYDYDRAYPYDFYRAQPAGSGNARDFAPAPRCSIERNVRVCRD